MINSARTKNATVILIGGSSGTGKSTLSKNLSERLNIIHRIGTGFIREIVRVDTDKYHDPYMFGYTFQASDEKQLISRFIKQCDGLIEAINSCISRALDEGTSLIIEGAHIIPGLIKDPRVTLTVILRSNNFKKHFDMIIGPTHLNRKISKDDFQKNLILQNFICDEAKKYGVPIIDVYNEMNVVEDICSLIKNVS